EELSERDLACLIGAAKQVRQALFSIQRAKTVRQVDPVPSLLDLIVGEAALELPLENAASVLGADLRERPDMDDELGARPQALFHGLDLAALQERPEPSLGRFDGGFIQLA